MAVFQTKNLLHRALSKACLYQAVSLVQLPKGFPPGPNLPLGADCKNLESFMRVVMIGTGYVGLVSGACFADFGHDVTCVDNNEEKIDALNNGQIPIFEPGLDDLVAKNVEAGRLVFAMDAAEAVGKADVVFIAVGTPTRRGSGHADLQYVYAVAEELAPLIRDYTVIVTKSTVPVGTGDEVEAIIRKTGAQG